MTIQKEHLEAFKEEKLAELEKVGSVFRDEEARKIHVKTNEFQDNLYKELNQVIEVKKARIEGEIAAIDRLIAKVNEPDAEQL